MAEVFHAWARCARGSGGPTGMRSGEAQADGLARNDKGSPTHSLILRRSAQQTVSKEGSRTHAGTGSLLRDAAAALLRMRGVGWMIRLEPAVREALHG